jgi:hypothetical protein
MTRTRTAIITCVLAAVLGSTAAVADLGAQSPGADIQPRVRLVIYDDGTIEREADLEARRVVARTIEARLRDDLRYRLTRETIEVDPERYLEERSDDEENPAIVIVRLAPRRDGTLRVELDLWYEGAYRWSLEEEVPIGDGRLLLADALASRTSRETAALFPGFARVTFRNTGADVDYYIYANGQYLGANLPAIELPVGTYEFTVERRDAGFIHTVGRRELQLAADDFYQLEFSIAETAPTVPGYLRLLDQGDRWRVVFDVTGYYAFPTFEVPQDVDLWGGGALATAVFNDVLFRSHILGLQSGYVGSWYDESGINGTLGINPLMIVTGISIGPVAKVDFLGYIGGGVARTRTEFEVSDEDGLDRTFDMASYSPIVSGTAQFGYTVFGAFRVSVTTNLMTVIEGEEFYSWIGIGLGVGARF